ncbi:suppressor of tumorigenicity 14 protein-like [Acanthaster planci]|uniref:Suppressor of tumorigenicity 14 protein-like n=1 Tax=Acanthaster planci TaxID=133434 RepID=A0A8B7YG35_ACAPL|nr:suppressor of tumorigenicity 14 protein-like [Acanthaster planci]
MLVSDLRPTLWRLMMIGFILHISGAVDSGCGGPRKLTALTGTLSSMNYGNASNPFYDNNAFCSWYIQAPTDWIITLTFEYMDIEPSFRCMADYVVVHGPWADYVGRPPPAPYCGTNPPPPVQGETDGLYVTFITNDNLAYRGFLATYEINPPPSPTPPELATSGCDNLKYRKEPSGTISSMGYDENSKYLSDAECEWVITASVGKVITLTFVYFDVEGDELNCRYDTLLVYDGPNASFPLLGNYCGNQGPSPVTSSQHEMYLRFRSDGSIEKSGFRLSYVEENPPFTCPVGTFQCESNDICLDRSVLCDGQKDCRDGSDEAGCPANDPSCGISVVNPDFASISIVGGGPAVPGAWPWQVQVRKLSYGQVCGATLINAMWAISAAHCFEPEPLTTSYRLILGRYAKDMPEPSEEQSVDVRQIILHENYEKYSYDNDIALLRLARPAVMTDYVAPGCLPGKSQRFTDGEICQVTGWGLTENTGYDDILKQAGVPIVDSRVCNDLHKGRITSRMMCAGYLQGGEDSCQGDSGGPLNCHGSDDRWYLAGITSWGNGCADVDAPGVYTRVTEFVDWVQVNILRHL